MIYIYIYNINIILWHMVSAPGADPAVSNMAAVTGDVGLRGRKSKYHTYDSTRISEVLNGVKGRMRQDDV